MHRRRRAAFGAALVTAVLLVAGCSAGFDTDPEAGPESPTSSGPTAEATEAPAPPEPPEPVDPCSLLTPDDLAAADISAVSADAVRGLVPDPRTTACLVPHTKEGWGIYYGFSTRPQVQVVDAIAQVGTEKPTRLAVGDDARMVLYAAYGDKIWHAWAAQGRYTVMVQLFEKPKSQQVEALLTAMLEQVDPDMFDFPIDLPSACPKPKEKAITNLLGTVVNAVGSDLGGNPRCEYANQRGITLNLSASPLKGPDDVRRSIANVREYYDEELNPRPGTTVLLSPGEGYAYTSGYVEKPSTYYGTGLQSLTVIGNAFRPLSYDADAFRALAVWWSAQRL